MRLHPRPAVLAAALLAPAAVLAVAVGGLDTATAAPSAGASPPVAAVAQPGVASQLQKLVAAGTPGAIAVVNDGSRLRVRAAGVADTRSRRALRPADRFRAGSITKSFVATVALQLVGEGRLSLSDTVERWLPGILPYGDQVTVRQLLNLTSGIPDNQDPVNAEFIRGNMTRSWSPRELVALVAGHAPDFAPGASWAYSNTNYVLAGLIIERVTGDRLGRQLARRIFQPLRLRHTSFPVNATGLGGRHANGYALVNGRVRDVTLLNPSGTWGAGNLVSTAPDIARFWRGLLGGRLLGRAQLEAMKTTVPAWAGTPLRYGLGLIESPGPCGPLWGNGGDIAGYSNSFQNSEDGTRQAGIVIDMNPGPESLSEPQSTVEASATAGAFGTPASC